MHIKISRDEANRLVRSIPSKTCQQALDRRWIVEEDGAIRPQSVYWLYCWAKTGMNSEIARCRALEVFDKIMPISFADFDARTNHEEARQLRYQKGVLLELW